MMKTFMTLAILIGLTLGGTTSAMLDMDILFDNVDAGSLTPRMAGWTCCAFRRRDGLARVSDAGI